MRNNKAELTSGAEVNGGSLKNATTIAGAGGNNNRAKMTNGTLPREENGTMTEARNDAVRT
jgi:hypothetical protein